MADCRGCSAVPLWDWSGEESSRSVRGQIVGVVQLFHSREESFG